MVENWRTQSKTVRTRMKTNNNLNPHVTPGRESDTRHNKGRQVLTPLYHPPPPLPKLPLSRFSISKGVLQDNLVLLTVFPDCFSYFSLSFCQKMYHCCKEKTTRWSLLELKGLTLHVNCTETWSSCTRLTWVISCWNGVTCAITTIPATGLSNQPINPLTPRSDQGRISPYNINTISSIEVIRIK